MKLWKIIWKELDEDGGAHTGYSYGRTRKEAIANGLKSNGISEFREAVKIDVEYSEKGIVNALNVNGSHPDNG